MIEMAQQHDIKIRITIEENNMFINHMSPKFRLAHDVEDLLKTKED